MVVGIKIRSGRKERAVAPESLLPVKAIPDISR